MTLASKIAPSGYTVLFERISKECPNHQFIREYLKNSIQAILRQISVSKNKSYKGKIEIDVDWFLHETNEVYKMTFVDNGVGMTGEEMMTYVNDLVSSSEVITDFENYGIGAKIAAALKNKIGIKYDSWKDGKGYTATFWYDPIKKIYGLMKLNDEGENKYWSNIDDQLKPKIIDKNGTKVTLFGNKESDDTYEPAYHGISATRESWVANYVDKRFFEFPENIEVRARLGHYREKSDSKHNYMRSLKGLKSNLDEKTLKSGQVKLSDAIVEWRIMDPSRKGHGRMFLTGHTAVIHEKEVFDISFGIGNKARDFGIYVGQQDVVLHVHPIGNDYVQNNTRSNIILRGEDQLPWERWASEFTSKFPNELLEYLKQVIASETESSDSIENIKDKLKELREFFNFTKYKKSNSGKYLIDEEDLTDGLSGGRGDRSNDKGGRNGTHNNQGNATGLIKSLISLQTMQDGKVQAEKANPDPFPDVKWVDPETSKSIEKNEILDRAAVFRDKQNIVFANSRFNGFTDVHEHFCKKYPSLPQEMILNVVRDVFAQQLMESVASAVGLKVRANWDNEDYLKAISPESLTVAVGSRYYFFDQINRRLNQKNTQKIKETKISNS